MGLSLVGDSRRPINRTNRHHACHHTPIMAMPLIPLHHIYLLLHLEYLPPELPLPQLIDQLHHAGIVTRPSLLNSYVVDGVCG